MKEIYYDRKTKMYFAKKLYSDVSGEELCDQAIYVEAYSRNPHIGNKSVVFGVGEVSDVKKVFSAKLYDVVNRKLVFLTTIIPETAVRYIPVQPKLSASKNVDCFQLADTQLGTEQTIDKTVCSGRLRYSRQPDSLSIEERDRLLLEHDEIVGVDPVCPRSYLLELQSAGREQSLCYDGFKRRITDKTTKDL